MTARTAAVPMTPHLARTALVALHVPYVLSPTAFLGIDVLGTGVSCTYWLLALPVSVVAGALQLHHSSAVADGRRPRAWPVTYLALILVTVVPLLWFGANWQGILLLPAASTLLLLPRLPATALFAAFATGSVALVLVHDPPATAGDALYETFYPALSIVGFGVAIPAAVATVRALTDVHHVRLELAARAVDTERARVARDLHDLVGQSLAAVALKGDLALRLLPTRPAAARDEAVGLTVIARTALREVLELTRRPPVLSLEAEIENAVGVLTAAGTAVDAPQWVPDLPAPLDDVLAWAVREAATNIVKHSDATRAVISVREGDGRAVLQVTNDRARAAGVPGSGLHGLTDRAGTVGGRVRAHRTGSRFRLVVDVPLETP